MIYNVIYTVRVGDTIRYLEVIHKFVMQLGM